MGLENKGSGFRFGVQVWKTRVRVFGSGSENKGSDFRVQGSGLEDKGLGFRFWVRVPKIRVRGSGLENKGSGFGVWRIRVRVWKIRVLFGFGVRIRLINTHITIHSSKQCILQISI